MNLIEQLKRHEGFRGAPYQDTEGVWTIGYGLTNITKEEAETILRMRVETLRKQLELHLYSLDPARQDVILNMAYNLGVLGVMGFQRMWAAIYRHDYEEAARQMLNSKWRRQVGQRAVELARIMESGR